MPLCDHQSGNTDCGCDEPDEAEYCSPDMQKHCEYLEVGVEGCGEGYVEHEVDETE